MYIVQKMDIFNQFDYIEKNRDYIEKSIDSCFIKSKDRLSSLCLMFQSLSYYNACNNLQDITHKLKGEAPTKNQPEQLSNAVWPSQLNNRGENIYTNSSL